MATAGETLGQNLEILLWLIGLGFLIGAIMKVVSEWAVEEEKNFELVGHDKMVKIDRDEELKYEDVYK